MTDSPNNNNDRYNRLLLESIGKLSSQTEAQPPLRRPGQDDLPPQAGLRGEPPGRPPGHGRSPRPGPADHHHCRGPLLPGACPSPPRLPGTDHRTGGVRHPVEVGDAVHRRLLPEDGLDLRRPDHRLDRLRDLPRGREDRATLNQRRSKPWQKQAESEGATWSKP